MLGADGGFASPPQANPASWALEHHVEVHAEDAGEGVVLDAQIDVLLDAEAEAACVREAVPVSEKFFFLSSRSLTFRPRSRISSALSPRTVTCMAIFSFRLMLKLLTV